MKKLQLNIVYSLNGNDPFKQINTSIDVMVEENWTAEEKHYKIINEVVKKHNTSPNAVNYHGYIKYNDVVINNMARLD